MARTPLPYTNGNKLADQILFERAKRTLSSEKNKRLADIENELAEYCSLSVEGIKSIKNRKASPSLPVALKICEFFNVDINQIFPLIEESEEERHTILGKELSNCSVEGCERVEHTKGLCRTHYNTQYARERRKKKKQQQEQQQAAASSKQQEQQ